MRQRVMSMHSHEQGSRGQNDAERRAELQREFLQKSEELLSAFSML